MPVVFRSVFFGVAVLMSAALSGCPSNGSDGTNGTTGATGATGATGPQGCGNDGAAGVDGARSVVPVALMVGDPDCALEQ